MAHIRQNSTSAQKGSIEYNSKIVDSIVALAIEEVDGVSVLDAKNKGIKLKFDKQGINASVSVVADHGFNVTSLAFRVQQSIKHNVETMTHYKVGKIDVHVADVRFPDAKQA